MRGKITEKLEKRKQKWRHYEVIAKPFFLSSQSVDCGSYKLYLCVCLSVCPAFTAYISLTMDQIFIKLSENVGPIDCINIS